MINDNIERKMKMLDLWKDPVWEMMDWLDSSAKSRRIEDVGFKNIGRPHNLVNIKDESGKVVAQELRVVTTPFAKNDVKVKICDNKLIVTCGTENIKEKDEEEYVYKGISLQAYSFTLALAPSCDQSKITAENKDGILTIRLPLHVVEEKKPDEIEIAVS